MEFISCSNTQVLKQELSLLMVKKYLMENGQQAKQNQVRVNTPKSLERNVVKTDILLFRTYWNSLFQVNVSLRFNQEMLL